MCGTSKHHLPLLCIKLLLAAEGVETNPGPISTCLQFTYGGIADTKGTGVVAPSPNGLVFTGPAYEVNHAVNNNSVIQLTSANYNNRFDYQQRDASYPMKGAFLYPIKIGIRQTIINQVAKKRVAPQDEECPAEEDDNEPRQGRGRSRYGKKRAAQEEAPRPPPGFGSLFKKPYTFQKRPASPAPSTSSECSLNDLSFTKQTKTQNRNARRRAKKKRLNITATSSESCSDNNSLPTPSAPPLPPDDGPSFLPPAGPKDKRPLFNDYIPYKERDQPEFTCGMTLDYSYINKQINLIFDKIKPQGTNVQIEIFYIDSTTQRPKTRLVTWASSNRAAFPKGKVLFPFCQEIVVKISNAVIISQPFVDEVRSDAAHFAAIFHRACELTSGFFWTVNPAGVSCVGETTYDKESAFVTVIQNSNAYRQVTLVPTNCRLDSRGSCSASQENIKQMFQSLGEEVTAACHGQKSLYLYQTTTGKSADPPNLVTIEIDHSPLDSWSYVGTVDDYSIAGKDVGCKQNITLRKSDKLTYVQFVGYDSDGNCFNIISPLDYSYCASYLKDENFENTPTDFNPANLEIRPTCKLLNSALNLFPIGNFCIFWYGFWSKYGGMGPFDHHVNNPIKKDISLKGEWGKTVNLDPLDFAPQRSSAKAYAHIESAGNTLPVKFILQSMQRTRMCSVPILQPNIKDAFYNPEDLAELKNILANTAGFSLFNDSMEGSIRTLAQGARCKFINDSGKSNLPTGFLNDWVQQYTSFGCLGRDYVDSSAVIGDSDMCYQDFDAHFGLVLVPCNWGIDATFDTLWRDPSTFSPLLNKGAFSGMFAGGRSSLQHYCIKSMPPNKDMLLFKFFKYFCEINTSQNRQWAIGIANEVVNCLPLDKGTKETISNVLGWVDTVLGILSTICNFVSAFLNYKSGMSQIAGIHKHFEHIKYLCFRARDMNVYSSIITRSRAGAQFYQESEEDGESGSGAEEFGDNALASKWYGAVPRHSVKQLEDASTECSPTPAISQVYSTFKQSYHELRNSGSVLNGFLTYDILKILFQGSAGNEALPTFNLGLDKVILTYHLWVQCLISGEMFRLDQIGLKQPSLSSFNSFAFADLIPVTQAGLPVTGKIMENGQSGVTWLETNSISCWDVNGNNANVLPRWGHEGQIEFCYADILDSQATNVLFIPGDWSINPGYQKMLAIHIILATGWGRYYPVVTHSFLDADERQLEAIFAVISGWTHVDGVIDLKVVLPATFPLSGTRFGNQDAAYANLRIQPRFGPGYGMQSANCPITWLDNNSVRHQNTVSMHDFVMSWLNDIGLNDLFTFATYCKTMFDLNQEFHDYNSWVQSMIIYHMPAQVIQKTDCVRGITSNVDLITPTATAKDLPKARIVRKFPHRTPEDEGECWFLPLNDQNRCVPHIYATRRDLADHPPCFAETFTHRMEVFNVTRFSLIALGMYKYADPAPSSCYNTSSTQPYNTFNLSTVRSIISSTVYSLLGIPPNYIITAQDVDERRSDAYDVYYKARTGEDYKDALVSTENIHGKSVASYKGRWPMWIGKQNSYSSIILTGKASTTLATYEDLYGDLVAVELVTEQVPNPVYEPSRKGSRFNFSKLAITITCIDTLDAFKLMKTISEFRAEQPSIKGLDAMIQMVDRDGNDYIINGRPLVPNIIVKLKTWKCGAELISPDPYLLTLCSLLVSSCNSDVDNTTFNLMQLDYNNLQAADSFDRVLETEIISEMCRENTISWYYAGQEQLGMSYKLIVPWAYTLKRPAFSNICPVVMSDVNSRRSIETLQGLQPLGTNQAFMCRLGASLTQPIMTNTDIYKPPQFSDLFGKKMPKNSKTPTAASTSSAPASEATSKVETNPYAAPAGGGVSESQDAGSGSTEM